MPEIWLGYGDSEIILDIKYENILNIIKPEINPLDQVKISSSIRNNLNLQNSTLILITTPFPRMWEIIKISRDLANESRIESVDILLLSKPFSFKLRQDISKETFDIARIESEEVLKKISQYKNIILMDKIEYDPVFGFSGSPAKLIKKCYPQVMNQIYASVIGEPPKPGLCGEALKISIEVLSKMDCQLIHVLSDRYRIASIYFGHHISSFMTAISSFQEETSITSDYSKSAFISGNSTYSSQITLGNSLNLLWNNCHSVTDGGTIVLLSENRGGINEGAISKYVEGRLDLNGLDKYKYIYELEHINFLQVLREKYEIILISTLPQVYLNKLGIKSISKIKDGLDWIIKKNGKFSKTNIIPTSEITKVTNTAT